MLKLPFLQHKINTTLDLVRDTIFYKSNCRWEMAWSIFSKKIYKRIFSNLFPIKLLFRITKNFYPMLILQGMIKSFSLNTEAVTQRCSVKKVFREISRNSQEITCARNSFSRNFPGNWQQIWKNFNYSFS